MRRGIAALALVTLVVACNNDTTAPNNSSSPNFAANGNNTCTLANGNTATRGFDELGYNRCARLFNGPADGSDRVLDGMVWGNPTYANDHLVMKWNAAWDACNFDRTPENCAGAWTDNEWNGMVAGGSGETWHYKIQWVGPCNANPPTDGGYCIWNEYEVILSHGTAANEHFWDAHATPAGYGN